MSDSQSKIEQRRAEAYKRRKKNVKRDSKKIRPRTKKRIAISIVAVVLVLVIAGTCFIRSNYARRVITAVKVGDTKITEAEYSYYYNSSFTSYVNMMVSYFGEDYLGVDLNTPLTDQEYSDGETYAEYFSDQALDTITEAVVLYDAAQDAGYVLEGENKDSYDTMMQTIADSAAEAGESEDEYIEEQLGEGFNMDLYKKMLTRELTASAYQEVKGASFEYTDDEREAYYEENKDDYAKVDVRYQAFSAAEATDDTEEVTAEDAEASAEEFRNKVTDEASFSAAAQEIAEENQAASEDTEDSEDTEVTESTLHTGYTKANLESVDTNLADWVFDSSRSEGDCDIVENSDGTTYYVVYIVKPEYRDEYMTCSVRHILFSADTTDEDAMATEKEKAEEVLDQWVEDGCSEDEFAELAEEYSNDTSSADNGGLYEGVYEGEMVDAFNDWCFDSSRQPGDYEIIESEYGYHIMYYVGADELPKWAQDVDDDMRDEDYNNWYDEVSEGYTAKLTWLGKLLRTEPIE